jgi:ABC-type Fe3+-hydroxamate transport system substrate-binding protein
MNIDDLMKVPEFGFPPTRVVSLVPSMTESLFDLGFGDRIVGVTDYCIHPAEMLTNIKRVGGVKDPIVEDILILNPDLVIASKEDNAPEPIEKLVESGVKVWVTFPLTVDDTLNLLMQILGIFQSDAIALGVKTLQMSVDWVKSSAYDISKVPYFCPIWYGTEGDMHWWMTFNQFTYSHDLLSLMGGRNVFAERNRVYPLAADLGLCDPEDNATGDTRFPRVTSTEIQNQSPELILLPDEPFSFATDHKEIMLSELSNTPAVKNGRIVFVDGSLITWPGTRLSKALQELPIFFV